MRVLQSRARQILGDRCENISSFFKSVQFVISDLNIEENGYRLITNSGEDGGQEVPHFHVHILAGEKIGRLK